MVPAFLDRSDFRSRKGQLVYFPCLCLSTGAPAHTSCCEDPCKLTSLNSSAFTKCAAHACRYIGLSLLPNCTWRKHNSPWTIMWIRWTWSFRDLWTVIWDWGPSVCIDTHYNTVCLKSRILMVTMRNHVFFKPPFYVINGGINKCLHQRPLQELTILFIYFSCRMLTFPGWRMTSVMYLDFNYA